MSETLTPPDSVRLAAQRGLELAKRFQRDGLSVNKSSSAGVGPACRRATSLANGCEITRDTLKRMQGFFKQHADDYRPSHREADGGPDAATITWQLWGGNAARDWVTSALDKSSSATDDDSDHLVEVKVEKVDSELGIVFGYAIVCKVGGEEYFDTQGDHIPEQSMLEATSRYMAGDRMAKVMHRGNNAGQVVYGFPVTEDIAKALGLEVEKTGFIVGMRPDDEEVLAKFASGEFTGFSIGGRRMQEEVIE